MKRFDKIRSLWNNPVLNKWGGVPVWVSGFLFILLFLTVILRMSPDQGTAFHRAQEIKILTRSCLGVFVVLCVLILAKCRNVLKAAVPCMLLFPAFIGLLLTREHGDTYRACCARVQMDMKYLITQIETYRIDYKCYPGSLQNLNFGIKQAGAIVPSQGTVSSGHSRNTQPNRAILDLFAQPDEPDRTFGYWVKQDEGTDKTGGYFIWSRGPDTRFDFEPERLCGILEKEGIQGAQAYFSRNEYDPTNGFKSPGDIVKCGGYFNNRVINNWPF